MNRWTVLFAALLMATFIAMGCSSGGGNPTAPTANPDLTGSVSHVGQAQTHLWGYYDVYVDVENQSVEAVLNRMCMFTANVTTFVNNPVTNLSFDIYGTPVTADYVDVDIDVTIKHPFPGMTEYNGYDVKGVFMGTGSATMKYSSKLKYAEYGTDQAVYDFNDKDTLAYSDPYGDELVGMPDGYTRWFNAKEFTFPGIMGYTQGKLATPAYQAQLTATLNAYKYFADGLGAGEDLWTWGNENPETNGVFAAGASNTRNYYLRFPTSGGVKYGYAVVASWIDATTHPANAPEAAGCKVDVTPDVYYVSGTDKGGDLILDVNLWGWDYQPTLIKIESTVLSAVHEFDVTEMTPTGGDENYSTYHCEIPADAVSGTEGNEYWVIAEYGDFDYTCDATPPGGAPVAKLAAFFRYDLYVSPEAYNKPPVVDSGVDGEAAPLEQTEEGYSVTASDPDGDPLTYSWTLTDVASGDPVAGFDGVPGNGDGTIDIDFATWPYPWALAGTEFELDCTVADPYFPPVDATTLEIRVDADGDLYVSNNADFASVPDNGTKTQPYSTVYQAVTALAAASGARVVLIDYGSGSYNETSVMSISSTNMNGCALRGFNWYTTTGGRPTISNAFGGSYFMYFNTFNGFTIQGLKFNFSSSYSFSYNFYLQGCTGLTIRDCTFTGSTSSSTFRLLQGWSPNQFKFVHNKVYTVGAYQYYGNVYFYGIQLYNGSSGSPGIDISYNEFTDIFPTGTNWYYTQFMIINWQTPSGTWYCKNNLFHHIKPGYQSGYSVQTAYVYYNYPYGNGAEFSFSNNTIDKLDFTNSANIGYGVYAYYSYEYGHYPTSKNNILSNYIGNGQYMYGYYHYYNGVNGVTYCDAYNVQYPWNGFSNLTGDITSDPLYVNNTTAPYDYHLQDSSPCKGTGSGGADMGCYGNMASGETIVGIITAQ